MDDFQLIKKENLELLYKIWPEARSCSIPIWNSGFDPDNVKFCWKNQTKFLFIQFEKNDSLPDSVLIDEITCQPDRTQSHNLYRVERDDYSKLITIIDAFTKEHSIWLYKL